MSETVAPLAHVNDYLQFGIDYECSDIHLASNCQPYWRRFGRLLPIWILRYAARTFSETPFEESQNELEKDREWLARNLPTSNAKKPS